MIEIMVLRCVPKSNDHLAMSFSHSTFSWFIQFIDRVFTMNLRIGFLLFGSFRFFFRILSSILSCAKKNAFQMRATFNKFKNEKRASRKANNILPYASFATDQQQQNRNKHALACKLRNNKNWHFMNKLRSHCVYTVFVFFPFFSSSIYFFGFFALFSFHGFNKRNQSKTCVVCCADFFFFVFFFCSQNP